MKRKRGRIAAQQEPDPEPVWRALASPVRRRILELLATRPHRTHELWVALSRDLSRYTVMQHLRVLEDAGLVVSVRHGRARYSHLHPTPLQRLVLAWAQRFARLAPPPLLRLTFTGQRPAPAGRIPNKRSAEQH